MKKIVQPTFEAQPELFYPVETFKKIGFTRAQCKCGVFYWRKSEKAANCGDCTYRDCDVGVSGNIHSLEKDMGRAGK